MTRKYVYSGTVVKKRAARGDLVIAMRRDGRCWEEVLDALALVEGTRLGRLTLLNWCKRNAVSVPKEDAWKVRRDRHNAKARLRDADLLEAMKSELEYHPEEGYFTWRAHNSKHEAGDVAGSVGDPGSPVGSMRYGAIKVFERRFLTHRLVWLFEHGSFPSSLLDHIDRNTTNNRIGNLRLATGAQNVMNRGASSNNRLGLKGVGWHGSAYRARITADGICHYLGSFKTPVEARAAWERAAPRLHGEFAVLDA